MCYVEGICHSRPGSPPLPDTSSQDVARRVAEAHKEKEEIARVSAAERGAIEKIAASLNSS